MRTVIIRHPQHIDPFNEPASKLSVLNISLGKWQIERLASYGDAGLHIVRVDAPNDIPAEGEMLVMGENLWFNDSFLKEFVTRARREEKPARAAVRADDPAHVQHGLNRLMRSVMPRGEIVFVDLWYFPAGVAPQVFPVVIESGGQQVTLSDQADAVSWWVPERAVCPVDHWVHLFAINIVCGLLGQVQAFERRARTPAFRRRAGWRSFVEHRPRRGTSAYVRTGKGCRIDPGTVFCGPAWIGDNVTIGPGCLISQSIIGSGVTLAGGSRFHRCVLGDGSTFPWGAGAVSSVLMGGASAGPGAVIEMSMIGHDSVVGPGAVLASANALPIPLRVAQGQHLVETGLTALGPCLGHNCRIGAGLVVYPARMVESDVVLVASPSRQVIMSNISYEESDHHASRAAGQHPRRYPRAHEQEPLEPEW